MEGFKLNEIPRLVIALIIVFIVGGIGSAATYSQIPLWYVNVIKPTWAPPNWLFGVVWTILYILIGTSLFMVWRKGLETKPAKIALAVFAVQLGLNLLWSLVFFGLHSILGGLVIITILPDFQVGRPDSFTLHCMGDYSYLPELLYLPSKLTGYFLTNSFFIQHII